MAKKKKQTEPKAKNTTAFPQFMLRRDPLLRDATSNFLYRTFRLRRTEHGTRARWDHLLTISFPTLIFNTASAFFWALAIYSLTISLLLIIPLILIAEAFRAIPRFLFGRAIFRGSYPKRVADVFRIDGGYHPDAAIDVWLSHGQARDILYSLFAESMEAHWRFLRWYLPVIMLPPVVGVLIMWQKLPQPVIMIALSNIPLSLAFTLRSIDKARLRTIGQCSEIVKTWKKRTGINLTEREKLREPRGDIGANYYPFLVYTFLSAYFIYTCAIYNPNSPINSPFHQPDWLIPAAIVVSGLSLIYIGLTLKKKRKRDEALTERFFRANFPFNAFMSCIVMGEGDEGTQWAKRVYDPVSGQRTSRW